MTVMKEPSFVKSWGVGEKGREHSRQWGQQMQRPRGGSRYDVFEEMRAGH